MLKRQTLLAILVGCVLALAALAGCSEAEKPENTNASEPAAEASSSSDNIASSVAKATKEVASKTVDKAEEAAKFASNKTVESRPPVDDSPYIGESIARGCALADALLTVDDVSDVEINLDEDGDPIHYDVVFKTEDTVYEYEINATTGSIVSKTSDPIE